MVSIRSFPAAARRHLRAAPRLTASGVLVALLGCAGSPGGPTTESGPDVMLVSPDVIAFYEGKYRSLRRPGAMAVSSDGRHVGYSLCPEINCLLNPPATELALRACMKAGGRGCRIFAVGEEIRVKYRVMGQ
jgi:hypothetical protein